jgi:hypothetical protein
MEALAELADGLAVRYAQPQGFWHISGQDHDPVGGLIQHFFRGQVDGLFKFHTHGFFSLFAILL